MKTMRLQLSLLCFLSIYPLYSISSLVICMMIRDEAVNLKVNLPLWAKVADSFVLLVDNRTVDQSKEVIANVLTEAKKKFIVLDYQFQGFGQSRTLSLQSAWKYYANASHVLIADPDWKPDLATINLQDLDNTADVFRFTVFDRNGKLDILILKLSKLITLGVTRRRMDWLLLHRAGLKMRYSLHEVLDIGQYQVKNLDWIVYEIEQLGTWHATVGHGHSHGISRYEFDLSLLTKDLVTYPHDPHVDYYLGITNYAYAEALFSEKAYVNTSAVENAIKYLEKRVLSVYDDEFVEERWASMYTLGGLYATPLKVNTYLAKENTIFTRAFLEKLLRSYQMVKLVSRL
jgi:hypothetical protein